MFVVFWFLLVEKMVVLAFGLVLSHVSAMIVAARSVDTKGGEGPEGDRRTKQGDENSFFAVHLVEV